MHFLWLVSLTLDTGIDVLIQCQKNISSNTHLTSRDGEMTPQAVSKVLVRELDWTHDSLNEDTQNAFHWRQNDKELMQQVKFIVAADGKYQNQDLYLQGVEGEGMGRGSNLDTNIQIGIF